MGPVGCKYDNQINLSLAHSVKQPPNCCLESQRKAAVTVESATATATSKSLHSQARPVTEHATFGQLPLTTGMKTKSDAVHRDSGLSRQRDSMSSRYNAVPVLSSTSTFNNSWLLDDQNHGYTPSHPPARKGRRTRTSCTNIPAKQKVSAHLGSTPSPSPPRPVLASSRLAMPSSAM